MERKKILFITTSHSDFGSSGMKTGVWLEEVATPYYIFKEAGFKVEIASILGSKIPIDPISETKEWQTADTIKFKNDRVAMEQLQKSLKLDELDVNQYLQVYLPGGHGPMWDFIGNELLTKILYEFYRRGKVIGAICHGVAALVDLQNSKGRALVKGKNLTAFSDDEENAVNAQEIVPFLLETRLRELGALYSKGDNFSSHVVIDNHLVTGQNPASSKATAEAMIAFDKKRNLMT
ncbi:type 1 glutamine amidotransferase domain-containing protein [Muricauda sp. JGD-17]|uniref:Type 1 glutamine amidotransferase domain-containing protein n=1 Tax=Flagellimonas ochracea TaxID=2696472 RepID=A0A964TFD5_9FLAO|nr:type 1 glutamine amidotransferase domain-containing protein [Allomuricauda ochracea]NAY93479.1 type 1 glutamine amidotransferase domain-containing protein [Allomuricauda ochracea]